MYIKGNRTLFSCIQSICVALRYVRSAETYRFQETHKISGIFSIFISIRLIIALMHCIRIC